MTATQSCSAKKVSESWQNLKKTPAKDTILLQSHGLEACILTKKKNPHSKDILQAPFQDHELLFVTF